MASVAANKSHKKLRDALHFAEVMQLTLKEGPYGARLISPEQALHRILERCFAACGF